MHRITCFPRLHFGLIDCGLATSRRFGGLGFTIEGPPLVLSAAINGSSSQDQSHALLGLFDSVDRRAKSDVMDALHRLSEHQPLPGLDITLESMPRQHVGLGTKTALLLGALRVSCAAAGVDVARPTLQRLSGRGGASGVGVGAFFQGGFLVDVGHPRGDGHGLQPSSTILSQKAPTIAISASMPDPWAATLILASESGLSGKAEAEFFAKHMPISDDEVRKSISAAYHEIVPAVLEHDLPALRQGVIAFQDSGFKRKLLKAQDPKVRELLTRLREMPNVAAGMSSMGPLLFAVHAIEDGSAMDEIERHAKELECEVLGPFRMRNRGYELTSVF